MRSGSHEGLRCQRCITGSPFAFGSVARARADQLRHQCRISSHPIAVLSGCSIIPHARGHRAQGSGANRYCGWTCDGRFIVKHKTQSKRLSRKLTAMRQHARRLMHAPLAEQHQSYSSVLRGHYGYHGMPQNWRSPNGFLQGARRIWFNCLQRRSQKNRRMGWDWFEALTECLPLPRPRITHPWTPKRVLCG